MIGLTNSVNVAGSSGEGDVIYATNDSSGTIAAGDKVWLNHISSGISTEQTFSSSRDQWVYFYPQGNVMYSAGSRGVERYDFNLGTEDWTRRTLGTMELEQGFINTFKDGTVVLKGYKTAIDSTNNNITSVLNGQVNPTLAAIYLGNNLCLKATSTQYNPVLAEYDPATNTYGTEYYQFSGFNLNKKIRNAFLKDNVLLLFTGTTNSGEPYFIFQDITNKSSPVLLKENGLGFYGNYTCVAATGTTPGNYIFVNTSANYDLYDYAGQLKIYEIADDYQIKDPENLPEALNNLIGQTAGIFYDERTNILTVGTVDNVYAWKFNETSKTFSPLNVSFDLSSITNKTSKMPYNLVLSEDLRNAQIGYSNNDSYVFTYNILYKFTDGSGWTIVDESAVNPLTITGFATGETDAEGRYEINTVLPDEVMITVNVTPDPDTFEFTGEAQ